MAALDGIIPCMVRWGTAVGVWLVIAAFGGCSSSDASPAGDSTGRGTTDKDASSSGDDDDDTSATDASSPKGVDDAGDVPAPDAPTADALLAKVASCTSTSVKGGFGLDGSGSISIMKCGSALHWKADLDVDCDGIQTPPCDTDPQGQPQTSIVDDAPHDVDPTLLPYFVIPLGKPETTWYKASGIALGQVGAVIYKGQVRYGIFADEAGGSFIGEASYAMCQLFLGKPTGNDDPCDPEMGGIDAADVTYITFTGSQNVAKGQDIFDHAKHTQLGVTAAKAWLAAP